MISGSAVDALERPRYCVAQRNASEEAVKAGISWACGQENGQGKVSNVACNQSDKTKCMTTYDRADIVFNIYYKRVQGDQQDNGCDFRGAAQLSTGEPNTFYDFTKNVLKPCQ
jgi:hypothetical protein